MPKKSKKPKMLDTVYGYALAVLKNEKACINAYPDRYEKPETCKQSVKAAIGVLKANDHGPGKKPKKPKDDRETVYGANPTRKDMSDLGDRDAELKAGHDKDPNKILVA